MGGEHTDPRIVRSSVAWLRGLWSYYLGYTNTAPHAAAAAGLSLFGILTFVDPWFAVLAAVSYLAPPIFLYAFRSAEEPSNGAPNRHEDASRRDDHLVRGPKPPGSADQLDGVSDSDSEDGDTDSDSEDGDTDSDSEDGDTDSDNN